MLDVVWWPSTGVVNQSQVPMSQMPAPDLLAGFAVLDSCAVSDALDALGLPPGLGGLSPMWGVPLVVVLRLLCRWSRMSPARRVRIWPRRLSPERDRVT